MKHIPNFITSLNLVSGFIAIVFAANGHLVPASWMILAAMIFDFMDGFSARLLKAYSPVGKELDSLADVVSFGVAPGIIIWFLLGKSIPGNMNSDVLKICLLLIAAIMPVCGAIRLAVFNTDTAQSVSFRGLPIPANALSVISFVIAGHFSNSMVLRNLTGSTFFLIILTIILSLLMVSRIPLLSLKVSDLKFRGNEGRYILISAVIIGFVLFGAISIPFIIPLYIITSLISRLF